MSYEKFKEVLKYVNHDYPLYKSGNSLSTAHLTTKQLLQHIEFIISYAGEYGIVLNFVEEEWERLLEQAHIQGETNV